MNTQFEAWSGKPLCSNNSCKSNTYNVGNSCGATGTNNNNNRMKDWQKYRIQVNASTGHWAAYGVDKVISPGVYSSMYNWRSMQVKYAPSSNSWPIPINQVHLDPSKTGIALFMAPTLDQWGNEDWGGHWDVHFSNVDCGWI